MIEPPNQPRAGGTEISSSLSGGGGNAAHRSYDEHQLSNAYSVVNGTRGTIRLHANVPSNIWR
jgi:hypothetical protein